MGAHRPVIPRNRRQGGADSARSTSIRPGPPGRMVFQSWRCITQAPGLLGFPARRTQRGPAHCALLQDVEQVVGQARPRVRGGLRRAAGNYRPLRAPLIVVRLDDRNQGGDCSHTPLDKTSIIALPNSQPTIAPFELCRSEGRINVGARQRPPSPWRIPTAITGLRRNNAADGNSLPALHSEPRR